MVVAWKWVCVQKSKQDLRREGVGSSDVEAEVEAHDEFEVVGIRVAGNLRT